MGLAMSDPLTFALWYLAAISAGLWVAPLDPSASQFTPAALERGRTLRLSAVVSGFEAPVSPTSFRWHQVGVEELNFEQSGELCGEASGGVILSTSGTTGTPKVILLGSAQLLEVARLVATYHRLEEHDRGFNPLPLWHINAEVVGLLATLVAGASLVLDERFHRTAFWSSWATSR